MSDTEEYRLNADVCAALADATVSPLDRAIWLRLKLAWLALAAKEQHRDEAAAAA